MALVRSPAVSLGATGQVGCNLQFQYRKRTTIARGFVRPKDANTSLQQTARGYFRQAKDQYIAIPWNVFDKFAMNQFPRFFRLPQNGFSFFQSVWIYYLKNFANRYIIYNIKIVQNSGGTVGVQFCATASRNFAIRFGWKYPDYFIAPVAFAGGDPPTGTVYVHDLPPGKVLYFWEYAVVPPYAYFSGLYSVLINP